MGGIGFEVIQGWHWSLDIEATVTGARYTYSTGNETWTNWSLVNFAINFSRTLRGQPQGITVRDSSSRCAREPVGSFSTHPVDVGLRRHGFGATGSASKASRRAGRRCRAAG